MRGRDADPLNILHEVATAATFVAAVCADQFLPSQVGIDPKVTQHQHQKEALHRLGYLEQAQGELLLGGRLDEYTVRQVYGHAAALIGRYLTRKLY